MRVPESIMASALDLGVRCEVRTWIELKKILLLSLPSSDRVHFSTRDPETKQQSMNKMEQELVDTYQKKTGIILEVPNDTGQ